MYTIQLIPNHKKRENFTDYTYRILKDDVQVEWGRVENHEDVMGWQSLLRLLMTSRVIIGGTYEQK